MLTDVLYGFLPDKKEYTRGNKKIIVSFRKTRDRLFKNRSFLTAVMVELSGHEFDDLKLSFDFLLDVLFDESVAYNSITVENTWLVMADKTGGDLFEKINSPENRHYRNMNNHFVLIDKNTWEVFFNPAGIENRVISKRLMVLKQEEVKGYDQKDYIKLGAEIKHVYATLFAILDSGTKRFFVKRIKRKP